MSKQDNSYKGTSYLDLGYNKFGRSIESQKRLEKAAKIGIEEEERELFYKKIEKRIIKNIKEINPSKEKATKQDIEKIIIPKNIYHWNKIIFYLKGERGRESITVKVAGDDLWEYKTDIARLGFKDSRAQKFKGKKCWEEFFYVMAMNKGRYPLASINYSTKSGEKERNKRQKWKEEIKNNLIYAFGINEDPIKWDKKNEEFVARFSVVLPENDRLLLPDKIENDVGELFAAKEEIPAKRV